MNDDGTHWMKGMMKGRVKKGDLIVTCWCAVGGIESVTRGEVQDAAIVALAETVAPGLMRRARIRHEKNVIVSYQVIERLMVDSARGIVMRWNDAKSRGWRDVDAAFRAAADRLEAA